jgi:hypothetical protein
MCRDTLSHVPFLMIAYHQDVNNIIIERDELSHFCISNDPRWLESLSIQVIYRTNILGGYEMIDGAE